MEKDIIVEMISFMMKAMAYSFDEAWDNHTSDNIKQAYSKADIRDCVED